MDERVVLKNGTKYEFKNEDDLNNYPKSKEHQKLLTDGPEMETVTAIDYII